MAGRAAKTKEERIAAGWAAWREEDFTWEGLATKPWQGWVVCADGLVREEASGAVYGQPIPETPAPAQGRPANLQDFWRADPATGKWRDDAAMIASAELINHPTVIPGPSMSEEFGIQNAEPSPLDSGPPASPSPGMTLGGETYHRVHLPLTYADGTATGKADWAEDALDAIAHARLIAAGETVWKGDAVTGPDRRARFDGGVWPSFDIERLKLPLGEEKLGASCTKDSAEKPFVSARFSFAVFFGDAYFSGAAFHRDAGFSGAAFPDYAVFERAAFHRDAWFERAAFNGDAVFKQAAFNGAAWFERAAFNGDAGFEKAAFHGIAVFEQAAFHGDAVFEQAAFHRDAGFREAAFNGAAVFRGAAFHRDAGFSGAAFPDYAVFERAAFHRDAWFERAAFNGDAVFKQAAFNGAAWFERAAFNGDAGFEKAAFHGIAVFEQAAFHGDAVFEQAAFHRDAGFREAAFHGDAGFSEAAFHGDAGFSEAAFHDDAVFERAAFHRDAWFIGAAFNGEAGFGGARFAKEASFRKVKFADVRFNTALFQALAYFDEAKFQGDMDFTAAVFDQLISFEGITWPEAAQQWHSAFDQVLFRGTLNIAKSGFGSFAAFDGATLERGIQIDEPDEAAAKRTFKAEREAAIKAATTDGAAFEQEENKRRKEKEKAIPVTPGEIKAHMKAQRETRLKQLERGCRVLKLAMEKASNKSREQTLYRFELLARRAQRGLPPGEALFSDLYGAASDYGASMVRPFIALALLIIAFGLGFLGWGYVRGFVDPANLHTAFWQALDLSWANVFKPLSALTGEAAATGTLGHQLLNDQPWIAFCLRALATVQSLCAIVLAFLFALAVRRRFQIS